MNISNFTNSLFHRLRSIAPRDPARDWLIIIIMAIFAFIIIIVWNMRAFDIVARGGIIGVSDISAPTAVFNPISLNDIRAIFVKRATEEAKYMTGVYRFTDPSQ